MNPHYTIEIPEGNHICLPNDNKFTTISQRRTESEAQIHDTMKYRFLMNTIPPVDILSKLYTLFAGGVFGFLKILPIVILAATGLIILLVGGLLAFFSWGSFSFAP